MHPLFKIFLISLPLVACSSSPDPRYRDTSMLERPPSLNRVVTESTEKDNSRVNLNPEGTSLGSTVYLTSTQPPVLMLKQPYALAWDTVGQGLRQSHLQITDREHDRGVYFVTYNPDRQTDEEDDGMLDKALAYFTDKKNDERYLLTVTDKGSETQISAAINIEPTQSSKPDAKKSSVPPPVDGAEKLLALIYKTMSETPKHKPNRLGQAHHKH